MVEGRLGLSNNNSNSVAAANKAGSIANHTNDVDMKSVTDVNNSFEDKSSASSSSLVNGAVGGISLGGGYSTQSSLSDTSSVNDNTPPTACNKGGAVDDQSTSCSVAMLSPPDQYTEVDNLSRQQLAEGDKWFLISCMWMRAFKKYCDSYEDETTASVFKGTHPGPINNTDILFQDGKSLKSSLLENVDFELIPEKCWRLLVQWYGLVPLTPDSQLEDATGSVSKESQIVDKLNEELERDAGSPLGEVRRFVIAEGCYVKYMKIEVYYLELNVFKYPDHKHSHQLKMSKSNTIDHLRAKLKQIYSIGESKNVRLYGNFGSGLHEISKMDATLQDEGIYSHQQITIEIQSEDGSWPKKAAAATTPTAFSSSSSSSSKFFGSTNIGPTPNSNVPGLCGLANLGNTCFMNSALQCMSNIVTLTEYFTNNYYKAEINSKNPLGMKGEIAREYGDLLHHMWSGNYSSLSPRSFKSKVGMFAPRFSGFQQHDSQELLSFLLDGLHEDLNRVINKPYIEAKDAENRNDEVVAKEAWENHKKRNDSVIVDMFHGQFKSTLVCPDCSKVSVTFDPYCFLSLPLPVKKLKCFDITFFKLNLDKSAIKCRVVVPDGCTVYQFQTALSDVIDKAVKPENMITTQVYNSRIHKTLSHDDTMGTLYGRDEYSVFETPCDFAKPDAKFRFVPLLFREKVCSKTGVISAGSYTCFGNPLFVMVPKGELTYDELYSIILKRIKPFFEKEENIDPKELDELRLNDEGCPEGDSLKEGEISTHNGGGVSPTITANDQQDIDNFDEKGVVNNNEQQSETNGALKNLPNRYFNISAVFSTGSADIQKIPRNEKFILSPQAYLACDWNADVRKVVMKPLSELVIPHPSLETKVDLKKTIQLEDCIRLFLSAEKLGPMDSWYCPQCKDLKEATKKFDLWTLPHILVIHLKRFSYNRFFRDKLDNKIDFPIKQLELNSFVTNTNLGHQVYDLTGVVNHYGGLGGGHYTAYCKHVPTGKWYDFDDTRVSVLQGGESAVQTSAAYVLFYQRREKGGGKIDLTPPSLMPNPDSLESSVDNDTRQRENSSEQEEQMDTWP